MNQLQRALKMNPFRLMKKIFCFEEIYTIGYRKRDGHTLLDGEMLSFDRIPFDENYWYADPILVAHGGKEYLLMESFDMRTQLGSIACSVFQDDGKLSEPRIIIQEEYHMSFPMVFTWNDGLYMIPETCGNHSLNLYRCQGDITKWTLEASFPTEEKLVDTAVVCVGENQVELITAALHPQDTLRYRWQKYRMIREDSGYRLEGDQDFNRREDYGRGYRMAGSLIRENGAVILPAQVSTEVTYGEYMYLYDFSGGDLTRMPVLRKVAVDNILLPDVQQKEHIGVHSYALSGEYEVIDMRYFRFYPRNRFWKIRHMLNGK
jgi:hypothetical protein